MSLFRDDEAAAQHRLGLLKEELAALELERVEAERAEARIVSDLRQLRPPGNLQRARDLLFVVAAVLVCGLGFFYIGVGQRNAQLDRCPHKAWMCAVQAKAAEGEAKTALLRKGCQEYDRFACTELAASSTGLVERQAREQACTLRDPASCAILGHDKRACAYGFLEACRRLPSP
jgi:hypothetical protein